MYNRPYNKSQIRWKVVEKRDGGLLYSIYKPTLWRKGVKKKAFNRETNMWCYDPRDVGFHVFVTRKDARAYRQQRTADFAGNWVVIKIKVNGFVAAGQWENKGRSETWKEAMLIKCV